MATKTPTFFGYPRPDGTFGARNHVGIIPSVTCAGDVAQAICRQVAGTVCYLHHQGCCQLPPDLERVTDTLISLGKSPNVGAVLIVTLGCEGTDHERMYEELAQTGKPVRKIAIQELGGTAPAIARGIEEARELVLAISGQQRVETGIENVIMSIKCGASDTTSGMASNCVIGRVADRLVDLGATVVFGETTEFIGGEDLLARRAVSPEVARRIYEIVDAMETRAKSVGCDMRRGQPTPGNIAGGLSSIEEKSLGAIVKSGALRALGRSALGSRRGSPEAARGGARYAWQGCPPRRGVPQQRRSFAWHYPRDSCGAARLPRISSRAATTRTDAACPLPTL